MMASDMQLQTAPPRQRETSQTPVLDVGRRLERMERVTHWLDTAFVVPGTRFRIGWDSLIGLVPGVGDAATTLLAGWIIHQAYRLGVSKVTLARMVGNSSLDMLLGSVPLAGDLFDATFKSNRRNLALVKRHLARRGLHHPESMRTARD